MRTRGYATAALLLILVLILFTGARLLGGQQAGVLNDRQRRRRASQSLRDMPRVENNHANVAAFLATALPPDPGQLRTDLPAPHPSEGDPR
jgi:phosphate transport system permease protein